MLNCRKSRNMNEKKRRDQFNTLINELCVMVTTSNRKIDKTTILKTAIGYLKNYNGMISKIMSITLV